MGLTTKPAGSAMSATVSRRAVMAHTEAKELIPGFGNVTAKDMIVPRLKLLQGLSTEVTEDPRKFFRGEFFHSVVGECIGESLVVVPLQIQRSVELWAPRDDERGILARSVDGIHWDKPNTKFEVRIRGRKIIWDTKGSVGESGLNEFGSSDPSNPRSAPIASLTYRLALFMPEHEEWGPCLMICAKTATKPIMDLISRINLRHLAGTPFYAQKYQLSATKRTNEQKYEWHVPTFRNEGNITDKDLRDRLQGVAQAMATLNVRADDNRPEEEIPEHPDRSDNVSY
jgi:hypothetical protein